MKQIDQFGKVSYHAVRTGLAFIVAGALFNVLLLTVPPASEVLMNLGFGLVLSWAAVWHGKKFGVIKLEPDGKYPRDGKNVWKVLVLDFGKRIIRERLDDIDRALQAVARRAVA